MNELTKEESAELFDQFLNEHGLWHQFKEWADERGYTLEELGFPIDI